MARRKKGRTVHGWVIIDKPQGMTSTQVVGAVRRIFDAQKAGHAGTLDPLATGVLVLALGRANNGGSRRDAVGYNDAGPGGPRNGSAGGRNGYGYDANGRPAGPAYAPGFTPADNADMDDGGPAGTAGGAR